MNIISPYPEQNTLLCLAGGERKVLRKGGKFLPDLTASYSGIQ
jgi:hypothetical protein